MFIYCIEVNNLKYFGFDTKPAYQMNRWKSHCKTALDGAGCKLHKAMAEAGIENCKYKVIEDGFESIVDLALAEIAHIKEYDSKNNGLNSTHGGDGMGKHLHTMPENSIQLIIDSLSNSLSQYNTDVKWANTTADERKKLTAHLHNDSVYRAKAKTLKNYYDANPEVKQQKGTEIKKWQAENRESLLIQNRKNSEKAALVNRKKVKIITPEGKALVYESKTAFGKEHGNIIKNVIEKTKKGLTHNGYKGWEIE